MTAPVRQYYDRKAAAELAQARGLSHITENSVENAAYRDGKLKRTRIQGRIYYKIEDIEAWLTGEAL